MIRLRDIYTNKTALVIFGGASIIENKIALEKLDKKRYTIFLESKALTPIFLQYDIQPDYYLMFFPNKCQSNAFQHVILQSFLANIDLVPLLRPELVPEYIFMKRHFNKYYEPWNEKKGPHKKYRYKVDKFCKNSPFDLLPNIPDARILSFKKTYLMYQTTCDFSNEVYLCDEVQGKNVFDLDDYFMVNEEGAQVAIKDYSFLNSAAIALFPILNYMGFKEIYFLGWDMSMLGSMEYAAPYTFKSMRHYEVFFNKAQRTFNANFKKNRKKFMRPKSEFDSIREILRYKRIRFKNIYVPYKYAAKIIGIENISFEQFLVETNKEKHHES